MTGSGWRSPRCWAALALLVVAWFGLPALEDVIYAPIARGLHLHMIQNGAMALAPYAWLMVVRLGLNLGLIAAILLVLGRRIVSFPLTDVRLEQHLLIGLGIGLAVMVSAILAIILCGDAHVAPSAQPASVAVADGLGWLLFDLMGATGEELYGRGAVLLVAAAFLGWRGALIASGLTFVGLHLGNPGASWIWLARLFLQGMLLAYAVYRTGSLWWSVGYHTGWNWASAPLFGAAGSGFLDAGHIFDFRPAGPALVTGGAVGPEGSVFAFVAVLAAAGLLATTTRSGAAADDDKKPSRSSERDGLDPST